MKKLVLLFAFFSVCTFAVNAQTCSKKAAAMKTANMEAAAKLASADDSIEQRVCEKSGAVSYVQKSTCPMSGKVSYADVEYSAAEGKFVNVSPSEAMGGHAAKAVNTAEGAAKKKATCTAKEKAACKKSKASCTKAKATATKVKS